MLAILFSCLTIAFADAISSKWQVKVLGATESSYSVVESGPAEPVLEKYDVAIVGGGLSGLTAALYLSDSNLSVLLLEKERSLGGLAFGGEENGIRFNRGAAYFTRAYDEEREIFARIGMGDYEKEFAITEPIDSYLWNGTLYPGLWEHEATLNALPTSFKLFKNELQIADRQGLIPNQPIELAPQLALDKISTLSWIKTMPKRAATRTDPESKAIYDAFIKDPRIDRKNPMKDVLDLVELFSRSALGTGIKEISAVAFANFYISEIDERFTSEIGTGIVAEKILAQLAGRAVTLRTGVQVTSLESSKENVRVVFQNDKTHSVIVPYVVFSAPVTVAKKVIVGLKKEAPEQFKLFDLLKYAHYSVHSVWTQGHPYRATYDTWTRAHDYSEDDFTDVINGRWQDKRIKGYEGMRDFKTSPPDDEGILTIYHPLPLSWVGTGYGAKLEAEVRARRATQRLLELYNPMLKSNWNTEIRVRKVETFSWPFSIHVVQPNFFKDAAQMRKPFGRIYFASNNLGTPSIEEALFRGHCAATNIREHMDPQFDKEPWTRCPIE